MRLRVNIPTVKFDKHERDCADNNSHSPSLKMIATHTLSHKYRLEIQIPFSISVVYRWTSRKAKSSCQASSRGLLSSGNRNRNRLPFPISQIFLFFSAILPHNRSHPSPREDSSLFPVIVETLERQRD